MSKDYIERLIEMLEEEITKIERLLSQNISSEFKTSLSESLKSRKKVIDKYKDKLF